MDSFSFKDITQEQITALEQIHDAATVKEQLQEYLGNPTDDVLSAEQRDILLDMHLYNLAFCKERGFSADKTSVFFAIVKRVLELDFATNDEAIGASFARFKKMVLQHAVQRSPVSCQVFAVDDVRAIIDYFTNSYYRHFNLYKYMFTSRLQVNFVQQQPGQVEEIRRPRPLNESMQVE